MWIPRLHLRTTYYRGGAYTQWTKYTYSVGPWSAKLLKTIPWRGPYIKIYKSLNPCIRPNLNKKFCGQRKHTIPDNGFSRSHWDLFRRRHINWTSVETSKNTIKTSNWAFKKPTTPNSNSTATCKVFLQRDCQNTRYHTTTNPDSLCRSDYSSKEEEPSRVCYDSYSSTRQDPWLLSNPEHRHIA